MKLFPTAALGVLILCHAASASAATSPPKPIAIGDTVRGALQKTEVDEKFEWVMDAFDLRATKGQRITITLKSEDFDSYIDFDRGDDHIEANDDGGDGLDARLVLDIPETGVYRINVTSSENQEVGDYTLAVIEGGELVDTVDAEDAAIDIAQPVKNAQPPAPPPEPIRLGQTVKGQLTDTSPLHEDDTPYQGYSFTGKRGQSVAIEMKSKAFDAYAVLLRRGYDTPVKIDDDGGDGSDAHLVAVLPVDGEYEIRANSIEEDSRGAFTLSLAEGPPRVVPAPQAITYGQVIRGELKDGDAQSDDGSFLDLYRLRGKAGDKVTVTLSSEDFDAFATMTVANGGREIASNDDGKDGTDSVFEITLPADAEYDIRANTVTNGESGHYLLGVSLAPR